MKRSIISIGICLVISACKNQDQAGNNAPVNHTQQTEHHHGTANDNTLQLNNGTKWKADQTTNKNVNELIDIINAFYKNVDKSKASYQKTAVELEQGLDKMIRECRMQGPEHEALHLWLEPLMKELRELKNASNEADAGKSIEAIQNQLNIYTQYFE